MAKKSLRRPPAPGEWEESRWLPAVSREISAAAGVSMIAKRA